MMMVANFFMMASPASNGEGNKNLLYSLNFRALVTIFTKGKTKHYNYA